MGLPNEPSKSGSLPLSLPSPLPSSHIAESRKGHARQRLVETKRATQLRATTPRSPGSKVILKSMRSCSSRIVSSALYVTNVPTLGATYCDCGRSLDGISAQVHEQFRIIITESDKPMITLFGLVWKQSLVVRGGRITDYKETRWSRNSIWIQILWRKMPNIREIL